MQKTTPTLYVCLDTNVLFVSDKSESSTVADNFFPPRVSAVIRDKRHAALNVCWVVPEMVRYERQYQMFQAAKPLISHAKKMPRLFADAWLSRTEDVEKQIAVLVDSDLKEHGVHVVGCNKILVDWDALCIAAGLRKPPFDPNDSKEKGFKDAIVAETFSQFCGAVLGNTIDTAIFVSDDAMLRRHVAYLAAKHRVKVLSNLDDLTNELNFLASDIPAEIAAKLPLMAQALLLTMPDSKGFWETSQGLIATSHTSAINVYPGVFDVKETGRTFSMPVFLEKKSTRVYFKCSIDIQRVGRVWVLDPVSYMNALATHPIGVPGGVPQPPGLSVANIGYGGGPVAPAIPGQGLSGAFGLNGPGLVSGHWEDTAVPSVSFGITWSADYSLNKEGGAPLISNPHFEELHLPS